MSVLVTGAAGFIGNELAMKLCEQGIEVIGIDNLNDYYSVQLKQDRLNRLQAYKNFQFIKLGVDDREGMVELGKQYKFSRIYHLAAQAGVRYSLENPAAYIDSNLVGFGSVLELARKQEVEHLIYASSSSIYGENEKQPFSEFDPVDHPVSLYAATKKSNEVMAHSYSHLYGIPTTGLRFFTVYGPWGRPDMAPFLFIDAVLKGKPIKVFNHGNMKRDFTYIDDIVEGVVRTAEAIPSIGEKPGMETPAGSEAPFQVFNIGNSSAVDLMKFIESIEIAVGKPAEKIFMDMQPGDVPVTYADTTLLSQKTGYQPSTDIQTGVNAVVKWHQDYYQL